MGNDADLWSRNCKPSPFLFTFNIKDLRIKELPGVAAHVTVKVKTPGIDRSSIDHHWGMRRRSFEIISLGSRILHDKIINLPYL
jgi:hypothetical protein